MEKYKVCFFIEAVTTVGSMELKRVREIEEITVGVTTGKIYVTAFLISRHLEVYDSLAGEVAAWISAMPVHIIHLSWE